MYVLAVGPDMAEAARLLECLCQLGYEGRSITTGAAALRSFAGSDLVLLDLNLPDLDGLAVCRGIRDAGDTPVIAFAGGCGGKTDLVRGLQAGADDCVAKPYELREVAARIQAVMRRACREGPEPDVIVRGDLCVDPARRYVSLGEREISLTRKEFELLRLLTAEPDRVLSRQELMARVWQDDSATSSWSARASRTLDTHIGTLRNKLGCRDWIVTVRGVGFRLGDSD